MTSRKDDIEFLNQYLQNLREWYEVSDCLTPSDLHEPSEKQRTEYETTEERVARLADANGFDGSLFRQYLLEGSDHDSLSLQSLHHIRRKIETVPRIIVKLEESEQDEKAENLTPLEIDDKCQQVVCNGKRYDVTEEQIRILKRLSEKPGVWIAGKHLRINHEQRVDRSITHLPEQIRTRIESHTRNGYRLKMDTP